jgi:hypothetical protein
MSTTFNIDDLEVDPEDQAAFEQQASQNEVGDIKVTGVVGETEKEFVIKRATYGLWKVAYEGGGEVPNYLSGTYTDYELAKAAIVEYKAKLEQAA